MRDVDVLIIGCGPTGATLANLIGQSGIRTLVLEKEPAHYPLPRAVHFDDEIMRVFQTVGIADALVEKVRVNPGMRFVDSEGSELLDWPRPPGLGDQGWHTSYRCHQPDIELLLREKLQEHESVELQLSAEVTSITPGSEFHEVTWVQRDVKNGGSKNTARARFVVGCDGANSIVRQALHIDWIDLGFKEKWLVIDTQLKRERPDLGDVTIQHCNPTRPITYVRCPENRRRWEMAVIEDDAIDSIQSPESIWSLLSRWITPEDASIERSALYTFQSTLAETWHRDRCFLAGDAAHLTPPFMGQGMCGGIRDAYNLAWKITHCVQHGHNDEIIDSYQTERFPHMRVFIETAMTLGSLINAAGTKEALQSALLNPDGSAKMKSPKPPLGAGLSAGSSTHRGMLCSQPQINQRPLDDVVGYESVLLISSVWKEAVALNTARVDIQIIESHADKSVKALLDQLNTQAVLIRPDRYIMGTANTHEELANLLQTNFY